MLFEDQRDLRSISQAIPENIHNTSSSSVLLNAILVDERLAGQETFSNFFIIKLFLLAQHLQTSLQFHNKYFILKPNLFLNNINFEPNSATD